MKILVLEDKLGITSGYMDHWDNLIRGAGFSPVNFVRYSVWKSPTMVNQKLLVKSGNRKSPGFNPDSRTCHIVRSWFNHTIEAVKPDGIICMDVALLGIFEKAWDIATIDHLRGGVYYVHTPGSNKTVPVIITVPISAIHDRKKPKDIRAVNDGAESQDEWEQQDHDPEEIFFEPYTVPFGRWVLGQDLRKFKALMNHHGTLQQV